MCTGSRIENDDGTCASTGGFTTGTDGAAQGQLRAQERNDRQSGYSGETQFAENDQKEGGYNIRAGRGTNLDDYTRSKNGLPPRSRWDNVEGPESLKSLGMKKGGNVWQTREMQGDQLDAINFMRDMGNKAGVPKNMWPSNSGAWSNPAPGVRVYQYNDFKAVIYTPEVSTSNVGTVQIKWGGVAMKYKFLEWIK